MTDTRPRPYWSPYAAGLGIGLCLIAGFYLLGSGLGASGAFTRVTAVALDQAAPAFTKSHAYWKQFFDSGGSPLKDWMIFQVIGVFLGGLIGALTAGRLKVDVEKGESITRARRFALAFLGGALTGVAARLARGCTSGQALSGGSLLAVGSWAFMLSVFAGGYLMAWFVRRQWS